MRPRKRFGQHFLSPDWARKVVDAIAPAADETFLEIGPGRGALTTLLASRARHVVAVEIDRDLASELRRSAPPNVEVVTADVLEMDLEGLVRDTAPSSGLRVAGNLPYNISSPILFRLIDVHRASRLLHDATVMLQREVVERLAAVPGTSDYGVLTILARLHADARTLLTLPPGAFRPAPKVWSAVARLAFREAGARVADPALFERLVKGLFSQRRKKVANALKPLCEDPAGAPALLAAAGIDPGRRPETLDLPELAALSELLGAGKGRAVL